MNDRITDVSLLMSICMHGLGRVRPRCGRLTVLSSQRPFALSYRLSRMSVAWLLGVLAFILSVTAAYAHGGGTPQLTNAEAGPYRVFAWTQPEPWRVGEVHISIAVTLPPPEDAIVDEGVTNNALDTPVTDAIVQATLTRTEEPGASVTVQAAPQELLGNLYYEADATLNAPGEWRVTVDVSGPRGSGEASFTTEVLPARSSNTLLIAGGVGLAVLAFAALAGVLRGRRTSEGVRKK